MADEAEAFPKAEGVRLQWADLPGDVRRAIETHLGAPVVDASSQAGGFSPGLASRVCTQAGRHAFVKAVSAAQNPDSPDIHRSEARIASALPASVPAPRLQWSFDDGDWVVLVFDDVDGRTPKLPWEPGELTRVLDAITDLSRGLTPSPLGERTVADRLSNIFWAWAQLAGDEHDHARLPPEWRSRLDELVAIEQPWQEAVQGDTLLHCDVRADNVLVAGDRVYVVDWPWACDGAPWLELVAFLPSVAMQGGPDPEAVWTTHPLSVGADPDAVDAFLCAFAGMLTRLSLQPPPPGLPTLRAFQAGQGVAARRWLAQRRGWPELANV